MRRFAWVPFAVALFAFALPFATVSCGTSTAEPTGADLVLRTAPEASGPDGAQLGSLVLAAGGGLATAAFLAFALALVAAVRRLGNGWIVLAGLAGAAALALLKTRGGGSSGGVVGVDASAGAFVAGIAGAAGALAVVPAWLQPPPARPFVPGAGLVLSVAGYLAPVERTDLIDVSYADSLNVREPWRALFWLLPVAAGVLVVACRNSLSRDLSTTALAILGPCALVALNDVWRIATDDRAELGTGPVLLLFGMGLSATWVFAARRAPAARPAAPPRAPARAGAQESPRGPEARGSAGSPPGGR